MTSKRKGGAREPILRFKWRVPDGGFRWLDGFEKPDSSDPRRYLVSAGAMGSRRMRYTPLPPAPAPTPEPPAERFLRLGDFPPTLFRTFAATPPTEKGILGFANQFGNLGRMCAKTFVLRAAPLENDPQVVNGEPFDEWRKQIWLVGQAITLEEARRHRGDASLSELIETEKVTVRGLSLTLMRLKEQSVPAGWDMHLQFPVRRPINLEGAARRLLDQMINLELKGMEFQSTNLHPTFVPWGLHGLLWYQLFQAFGRDARHVSCEVCGKWFEARSRRAVVKYCSPRCQMRAHRDRQELARELHSKGNTPEQIAKRIGSKPATVRTWIKRATSGSEATGRRRPREDD